MVINYLSDKVIIVQRESIKKYLIWPRYFMTTKLPISIRIFPQLSFARGGFKIEFLSKLRQHNSAEIFALQKCQMASKISKFVFPFAPNWRKQNHLDIVFLLLYEIETIPSTKYYIIEFNNNNKLLCYYILSWLMFYTYTFRLKWIINQNNYHAGQKQF